MLCVVAKQIDRKQTDKAMDSSEDDDFFDTPSFDDEWLKQDQSVCFEMIEQRMLR